jgi:alkanesulfonate monooxygenase SsuD/methylene tetrahydromethanopterin reductase-like flavin-dependent oxidoreductase (luciferase family)
MASLSFGIKTSQSQLAYAEILRVWQQADSIPTLEHAWLWDHMIPLGGPVDGPTLEAWTLLAALAAQTRRLRLGVLLTSNRLRSPALLAKMAATVDVISAGRLEFGIGAGGAITGDAALDDSVQREFSAYGYEVVGIREANEALGEACEVCKRMWTESAPFDFDGRHYTLRGAIGEPKPIQRPGPPVTIGAGGERVSLGLVARHADVWNAPTHTVEEFAHKSAVLDQHCAAIGRDPAEITRSIQVLVDVGDPAATRAEIRDLVGAGATRFVLWPQPPWPDDPARWLADEIVEPLLVSAALGGTDPDASLSAD